MKRRYKIASGTLVLVVFAFTAGALMLSHDSACPSPQPTMDASTGILAVQYHCYGSPDVLKVARVDMPVPADDEVLVNVQAASVNPLDWHYMRGLPYIMRMDAGLGAPKDPTVGVDFAGTVQAIGKNVRRFKVGDEVFGGKGGAFAEYLVVGESQSIVHKPLNTSFAEAAAVPIAGVTALEALRDKGQLQAGQKVLINGASGGVGTFAVQIAKALGAEVTGVCSTRNVEMVRSLGADHVVDYTKDNYTLGTERYDLIVDMVSNHTLSANRNALTPTGRLVIVGGGGGNWLGPLMRPIHALLLNPFVDQDLVMLLAGLSQEDLEYLARLMEEGKLKSVIDRHYDLQDAATAIAYSEEGRARGKIIIDVE